MTDAIVAYILFIAALGAILSLVIGFIGALFQWVKDRQDR